MKVENGKIVECTESELFDIYLRRGFDDLMSFTTYKRVCTTFGTHIVPDKKPVDDKNPDMV